MTGGEVSEAACSAVGITGPSFPHAARHATAAQLSAPDCGNAALNNLDRFVTAYEYIQAGQMRRDRVVFYSRFDGIWRRGVIVATQGDHAPSILVTLYRRDEKKVRKAIEGGMLFRRGEGGWK